MSVTVSARRAAILLLGADGGALLLASEQGSLVLIASEGDKALLQKELTKLMEDKAKLEQQLNDLQFLKKQVALLKAELSISKRLEWIRQGLFAPGEHKGASQLMTPSTPKTPKPDNYDLNVEIKSDGSVKVIPGVTNAPAPATK